MTDTGRIPAVRDESPEAMDEWCAEMADRGLLFHPDDPPATIEHVETGRPLFSAHECGALDRILDRFLDRHGTDLYAVCLHHTQRRLGIPPG